MPAPVSPPLVPKTMRAAVFDVMAPHGVRIAERPRPSRAVAKGCCGRGAVVCAVRACGVNPVDAKYVIGDKLPESWMAWAARRVQGSTPGFDFSGEVLNAPPGSGLEAGDAVFGFGVDPASLAKRKLRGSFAEVVAAPLDQVAKKPATLSHIEAAALPLVGTTALQALREHGVAAGQRVLVVGASGGVGHVGVQVARAAGASVVGVCSGSNADFVTKCGADVVVDYRDADHIDQIAAAGPYDIVLDCVSSAAAVDRAHSYLDRVLASGCVKTRQDGADAHNYVVERGARNRNVDAAGAPRIATGRADAAVATQVFGGTTGQWLKAAVKRFTCLNLFKRGFELFWIKMPRSAPFLAELAAWADQGRLRPTVNTVHAFDDAGVQAAFEALRGRRTAGKIVMDLERGAKDK